ncbi:related to phospholipase/esterase [Rhynchosporium secalis]|uniref:Related to phospholipase/esterase n=1 Tax=Rhynchosporium secalis TaxID=38038 RepID=A0A1E1LWI8_RHYSE|nr:related to phospholipase/esterase [Rhynchosporium secalis]
MSSTQEPANGGTLKEKKPRTPNGQYPEPEIISPQSEHRQTFVILHGRGSTAKKFIPPLLEMETTSKSNLQKAFPHAKLVFLTASRTRATLYGRAYTHQWFNGWKMDDFDNRQDLMTPGLHTSCKYVHGILQKEIAVIGEQNVVLCGLSQGCATFLTSLLTWDGKPFAATVGMCGYLPFATQIEEIATGKVADAEDDGISFSDDEEGGSLFEGERVDKGSLSTQAVQFLRDQVDLEDKVGMVFQEIPVFLGHGIDDAIVPVQMGRDARNCIELVGGDVKMIEYEGLDHWYSPAMLDDISAFLSQRLRIHE